MNEYIPVHDPAQIDRQRHALIEASAGTGKTYTIEHLALALIRDDGLPIDRLLVLTFTEKATGELRARIRRQLEEAARDPALEDAELRERLQAALDSFDTAGIHTIHGFCQTVLRRYGFELGRPLYSELVDDAPILRELLRDRMRQVWPSVFGAELAALLEFSGYPEHNERMDVSRWEQRVLRIAGSEASPRTLPVAPASPEAVLAQYRDFCQRVRGVLDGLRGLPLENFADGFAALNQNSRSRDRKLRDFVSPFLELLEETAIAKADSGEDPTEAGQRASQNVLAVRRFLEHARSRKLTAERGFRELNEAHWTKAGDNSAEVCPQLGAVVDGLEELRALDFEQATHWLAAETIQALAVELRAHKRRLSLVSFQDLLDAVDEALTPESDLLRILRAQYPCAIVDEFQDTDPVQWSIFEKLYLADGASGRLMLVGDPKQAIYAFRGGDVFTYFRARRALEARAQGVPGKKGEPGQAGLYRLATNYRSTPELVRVHNALFGGAAGFPGGEIEYAPALEAPPEARKLELESGAGLEIAPLELCELDPQLSPNKAKRAYYRWLARRLRRLVQEQREIRLRRSPGEDFAPLGYSDICILLRSHSEAPLLEAALDREALPHSYYKKAGLYQSPEALELAILLQSILDPADSASFYRALLTRFFRKLPADIARMRAVENVSGTALELRLIEAWHLLALERSWPAFFRALQRDSAIRELSGDFSPRAERMIANYEQISDALAGMAMRENLDLRGIVDRLAALRDELTPVREEWDVHHQESEAERIKIMTIHTSKGLEFPVVCVAGGFSARMAHIYESFRYHDDSGQVLHDLARVDEERFRKEESAEEERLYYVALTRAAVKLVLPYYRPEKARGQAGPLAGFVRDALDAVVPQEGTADTESEFQVHRFDSDQILPIPPTASAASSSPSRLAVDPEQRESLAELELLPAPPGRLYARRAELLSYTALARRRRAPAQIDLSLSESSSADQFGEVAADRDAENQAELPGYDPESIEVLEASAAGSAVPVVDPEIAALDRRLRGADAGVLLHDLLEQLDYTGIDGDEQRIVLSEKNRRLLLRLLRRAGFLSVSNHGTNQQELEDYEETALQFVGGMLRRVLFASPGDCLPGLRLHQLVPADRIHEMEFYFHVPGGSYVWGFIDLVFRFEGRYYLADWKSNVLDDYDSDALALVMREHHYDLQARLYAHAVLGWLRQHIVDFDYERDFGGVFYFFLRGMHPGVPGRGVYFERPELKALSDFASQLPAEIKSGREPGAIA